MEFEVYFPGNKRVYADFGGFTVETDQPLTGGGDGSAPAPFDLFLASLATCAGIFVLGFMQQRRLSTEGTRIRMRTHHDPEKHLVAKIDLDIDLPADFPEHYREAVIRAAELCTVKRHLADPPAFAVKANIGAPVG
jgi:ribosomal protein S12 methylthiotransferase accessory factor